MQEAGISSQASKFDAQWMVIATWYEVLPYRMERAQLRSTLYSSTTTSLLTQAIPTAVHLQKNILLD